VPAEPFPKRLIIAQRQFDQLRGLLNEILPANQFYAAKFNEAGVYKKVSSLADYFERFPFTTKQELARDQAAHPPYGTNLTYPLERYTRCHQTSGTAGQPLRWLDTPENWNWLLGSWQQVLVAAGVRASDRVFFAFSFGPFIAFWLAFEAAQRIGCLCLPGGGMSTLARLRLIFDQGVTALCATPTYAIHLGETAAREGMDLSASPVKTLLVAGEPGGSIPNTRAHIEKLWPGARVFDHHGMTETGPVSFQCSAQPDVLHIMENAYIAEVIDPASGKAIEQGGKGELVLTSLGRTGSPLLRYRTGDLVKTSMDTVCACGRSELALEGGILSRTDDMVIVRGVNVYPSAVEEIIRATGAIAEYQARVSTEQGMTELTLHIEPAPECSDATALAQKLQDAFSVAFGLRIPVKTVAAGSLPRFELKAKRWVKGSVQ
jgi:phenylacetate-CoA ligase